MLISSVVQGEWNEYGKTKPGLFVNMFQADFGPAYKTFLQHSE